MNRVLIFIFNMYILNLILVAQVVRIKDITTIKGIRSNQLTGYGIVIGLNGTGDTSNIGVYSAINMLKKFGVDVDTRALKPKNVAAVIVTATLPPFVMPGEKIDILVSSIGDATSLQGGVLLQTPLIAANGKVYAVAAGPISIGGISAGIGARGGQNHLTVATIPDGALVERDVNMEFVDRNGNIHFLLKNKDFTTASRIEDTINNYFGLELAKAINSGDIKVKVPYSLRDNITGFIAKIQSLDIALDKIAQIIINERTGTIVMGENVKISKVAVMHGDLKVTISEKGSVNSEGSGIVIDEGASVDSLVKALNSVGATPKDIIAILEAMKAAGAIHAELKLI